MMQSHCPQYDNCVVDRESPLFLKCTQVATVVTTQYRVQHHTLFVEAIHALITDNIVQIISNVAGGLYKR